MNAINLFQIAIGILLLGAVVTFLLAHQRRTVGIITTIFFTFAAVLIYSVVIQVFRYGPVRTDAPLWQVPGIGASLVIQIDYLSAIYLAIISLVAVLAALYSIRFMQLPVFAAFNLRAFYPILLIFFTGVMCVVAVADMFFFFIFWEIMTLTSYLLVIFNKNDQSRLRAGFKYLLITQVAVSLLFIATIILYRVSGSFSFNAISNAMAILASNHPGLLHLVLLFFFLGFATKAGILPMGDWLPDAYPAAPAPATAAFAGSMTKLGIYGIIRIFCELLPISGHTSTWGGIIAVAGTISIFIGTMTALFQEDSKRLLAFQHIGQMGYMLLGIGIGIHFLPNQPILAIIGIGAGVFHLINHVSYQTCLFFNAGSVYWKVGTRNLNKVGGLARILPITAIITVIASLSISGIPPFSGFASKWLIYQASIQGGIINPLLIALGITAIFISAVTLASFVKFFSAIFYGKYADNNLNAQKGDVPITMMIPQVVLAIFCVVFGIVPLLPIKFVFLSVTNLFPANFVPPLELIYGSSKIGAISLSIGSGAIANWNPIVIIGVGFLCFLISYTFYKSGNVPQRVDTTWYCGEVHEDQDVRYRANSFFLTFNKFFRIRVGKYERSGVYPTVHYPQMRFKESNLFKKIANIDKYFYYPLVNRFLVIMKWFSTSHSGIPQFYLLWAIIGVFLAIIVLFLLSATGA